MRRLSRNRKAVSNVIGTILMILVVVVGMSMAFGYFVNFVKDYQAGRGASVMELVSIEDVWFKNDSGNRTIDIWLYNSGKVSTSVSALYINGQQQPGFNGAQIPIGGHAELSPVQFGWGYAAVYDLKFVTDRGTAIEGEYASPARPSG
ncbi:MAG: archaellin/type IV pilin N-terminal domain-containing protein [Candidatus Bathyarchaeia archaeon]|jgi:flagellin-like protein